jgi:hypothetical protein
MRPTAARRLIVRKMRNDTIRKQKIEVTSWAGSEIQVVKGQSHVQLVMFVSKDPPISLRLPSCPKRPTSHRSPTPVPARLIALVATRSSTLVSVVIGPKVRPFPIPVTFRNGNNVVSAGGDVTLSRLRKKRLQCGRGPAVEIDTSPWSEAPDGDEQKGEKEP